MMQSGLKAPFPWFGGKARIASEVWARFGDVPNYVEPFFGSGAVLLNRPIPFDGVETINDADGFIANAWRAIQADPDAVAEHADRPIFENDLHAIHSELVALKDGLPAKLEGDINFYDARVAGLWLWGIACWIGSGFCSGEGPWQVVEKDGVRQLVHLGDAGQGVNRQRVHLGDAGRGVNRKRDEHGHALREYMAALSRRLRHVRVCCGDWTRVMGDTPTTVFTPTAIFLDPPYADTADRQSNLYRVDCEQVAHAVREWAIKHGDDKRLRIALCGYECEHNMPPTWKVIDGKAGGGLGYGGQAKDGYANARRERIWFSPHCIHRSSTPLLDSLDAG